MLTHDGAVDQLTGRRIWQPLFHSSRDLRATVASTL